MQQSKPPHRGRLGRGKVGSYLEPSAYNAKCASCKTRRACPSYIEAAVLSNNWDTNRHFLIPPTEPFQLVTSLETLSPCSSFPRASNESMQSIPGPSTPRHYSTTLQTPACRLSSPSSSRRDISLSENYRRMRASPLAEQHGMVTRSGHQCTGAGIKTPRSLLLATQIFPLSSLSPAKIEIQHHFDCHGCGNIIHHRNQTG